MKILIQNGNYTFTSAAKTVSLNAYGSIDIENVLLITNVVDGIIIYNFTDPAKGGTVATNVVTLDYDTTTMADTDELQIWYWDITASEHIDHGKTIKTVTGTVSADTDIVAAVTSKRIKVIAYALFSASTMLNTITFQSNASTALWTVPLQSSSNLIFGANLAIPAPSFLFATVAGEKLTLDVSAAVNVTYSLSYYDDDAS